MCGIAGRMNFDAARAVAPELVRRMCDAIAHRGPDDAGVWCDGAVGLGHRRLSIVDLSAAGHQPMVSPSGACWIVFNGEIYNFLELRAELEAEGVAFRSRTDTEVILALYERHGIACLEKLRGMFAFALYDVHERRLFLARDRVGVKPLCYHAGRDGIAFASEVKALLQDPAVGREPDPVAIHHYLTYQAVPAPMSAFRGVRKLPPGHYLEVRDGELTLQRYWKLSYADPFPVRSAREERALETELIERLEQCVKLRMISDVPLGAFLSGGVDSSAVVALMARHSSGPVRTFSIGFDDDSYDELVFAREVASRFGARHIEFTVKPSAVDILPHLVRQYDEPFADASAIPTWYVSQLAREHVTVVLNGDGGDESFAGYDRYVANDYAQRLSFLAPALGSPAFRALLDALPHGATSASARWRLKRFIAQLSRTPEARNAAWMAQFDPEAKAGLYSAAFRAQTGLRSAEELLFEKFRASDAPDFLSAVLDADVQTYLPDTLCVKVDIATMTHALEARSPFLDHTLMEFAARIPMRLKLQNGQTKRILKRALRGVVPDAVLDRRKMGFNAPVDRWLQGELRELANDLLRSDRARARGWFQPEFVGRMLDEHDRGTRNWHVQIWNLMMLESWMREFVDAPVGSAALVS
ncbi:MAG: asparagine synthase (glutamine-hydrolyzing) [Candidatus Eisenbacteria bacterium]